MGGKGGGDDEEEGLGGAVACPSILSDCPQRGRKAG
jgi:hypothetical protein